MTNPYTTPSASGPAPKWARKRYVLPALALALFVGVGIGAGGGDTTDDAKPAAAKPTPTVTVTATATATETAEPEPAATVTATETVKVTKTVTARAEADTGSDSDSDSGGDAGSVYYANCSEAVPPAPLPSIAVSPVTPLTWTGTTTGSPATVDPASGLRRATVRSRHVLITGPSYRLHKSGPSIGSSPHI